MVHVCLLLLSQLETITPPASVSPSLSNFPVNIMGASPSTVSIGNYVTLGTSVQANPFYLRIIEGNIRICQGCCKSLRNSTGSIPAPLFNLCVARLERRSFFDQSGLLRTPKREQASHYHAKVECIRAVCANFTPSSLQISYELRGILDPLHKDYISSVFGVTV